tara:strand:+ start:113 stop:445 length:333 start_codon:yes stop_codon:yes gene_type:complete
MNTQKRNSATVQTKKSRRYAFAQKEGEDHTCIKLTEGQYEGIIYKYGKVGIPPKVKEDAEGKLPLTFDYTVVKNPKDLDILDNQEFINYIGDILVELLDEQLKNGQAIIE